MLKNTKNCVTNIRVKKFKKLLKMPKISVKKLVLKIQTICVKKIVVLKNTPPTFTTPCWVERDKN